MGADTYQASSWTSCVILELVREKESSHPQKNSEGVIMLKPICLGAGDGIRTHEHLRDWTLNPAPLTWLGNPRKRGSTPHALVLFNSIRRIKIPPVESTESCDSR